MKTIQRNLTARKIVQVIKFIIYKINLIDVFRVTLPFKYFFFFCALV